MATEKPVKMSGRTKGALWLLIAPTALIIGTFLIYGIVNWIAVIMSPTPADGELFATQPIGGVIINVIFFIFGTIGIIAWLPGLIAGIVLLATAKK